MLIGKYVDIKKKTNDFIYLSNGDTIFELSGIYEGMYAYEDKKTKYVNKLPDIKNMKDAIKAYEEVTGNAVTNIEEYIKGE